MMFRKNYIGSDYESAEFKLNKIRFTECISNISIHFEQQKDNDGEATASLSVVLTDTDGSNVGQVNEELSKKQLDILINHLMSMRESITKDIGPYESEPVIPPGSINREPIISLQSNDSEPARREAPPVLKIRWNGDISNTCMGARASMERPKKAIVTIERSEYRHKLDIVNNWIEQMIVPCLARGSTIDDVSFNVVIE